MKLTGRDWLMIGVLVFYMVNLTLTNFVMFQLKTCAGASAQAEDIAYAFELNPIKVDIVKDTRFIAVLVGYMIMPAAILAVYLIFRRFLKKRKEEVMLDFFVYLLFFMVLCNFANDLGAVLGVLL